ncbi:hypothetical protein CGZ80_14020 [Rhodopirellula sp. MGV]|nr:hypothetical protein CGZ80_14020 [Rhodopirellula sp. MGV]PNY34303.1 hypothetical protein C2E31_24035 [Rhodopirellula baltica]
MNVTESLDPPGGWSDETFAGTTLAATGKMWSSLVPDDGFTSFTMFHFQLYRKALSGNQPLSEAELRQLEPNERFFYADLARKRGFPMPSWFLNLIAQENPLALASGKDASAIKSHLHARHASAPQTQVLFQRRAA